MRPSSSPAKNLRSLFRQPQALLYNVALVLAAPVLLSKKWKRSRRARHGYELDMARWTVSEKEFDLAPVESEAKHIVFVGIGRSEMLMAERVGREMLAKHPNWRITWAVRDRLSITEMRHEWPQQLMVVMPFDFCLPVARWLAKLQPDALVFCEKFWFVNLAHGAKQAGTNVAVINTRAPDEKGALFNRWILKAFDLVCVPSQEQDATWKSLLGSLNKVKVTGSNRFDLKKLERDTTSLREWLDRGLPLLMAGSTWELDENFVLDAFAKIQGDTPCALLIAPRRFERGAEIAKNIRERGFRVSTRTAPAPEADVFVLDTMGELMAAYQFASGAFIGSTIKGKGHNVAEPVFWGLPVAYGPAPGHFDAEQRQCEIAGVGFRVHTEAELTQHWKHVLEDADFRAAVRRRAAKLFEEQGGAVLRTAEALEELLRPESSQNSKN